MLSTSDNVNSSMVWLSLLDPPVLASRHHPWRTGPCCPLHQSRSWHPASERCLEPPTPPSSRSCFRYTNAPPRRPRNCLAVTESALKLLVPLLAPSQASCGTQQLVSPVRMTSHQRCSWFLRLSHNRLHSCTLLPCLTVVYP